MVEERGAGRELSEALADEDVAGRLIVVVAAARRDRQSGRSRSRLVRERGVLLATKQVLPRRVDQATVVGPGPCTNLIEV